MLAEVLVLVELVVLDLGVEGDLLEVGLRLVRDGEVELLGGAARDDLAGQTRDLDVESLLLEVLVDLLAVRRELLVLARVGALAGGSSSGLVPSAGVSSPGLVSSAGVSSSGLVSSAGVSSSGLVSSAGVSSPGLVSSAGVSSSGVVPSAGVSDSPVEPEVEVVLVVPSVAYAAGAARKAAGAMTAVAAATAIARRSFMKTSVKSGVPRIAQYGV
ncbi:hypothetical protein [Streptomyces formicae]|uniref:hypothetical protein n=1 Tax=Streptomyces formicae TaxID=1616117 RepID=UPI001F5670DD|nr:hypothetical protein [Streptomyces formicae]